MNSFRLPRALFDVTQFVHWPATSGVQRVLRHLAAEWEGVEIDGRFAFLDGDRYVAGPLTELGTLMESAFRPGSTGAAFSTDALCAALRDRSDEVVAATQLDTAYDAYVLPEPTLRPDNLAVATSVPPATAFFVYYDALPLTHPHHFSRGGRTDARLTRYHRAVAQAENVAFISSYARDVFERRIARRSLANGVVARPGADGLPSHDRPPSETLTFVVVGTVEARKRLPVVLDAFEQLWARGHDSVLRVLGAPGSERSEVFERLTRLERSSRVSWSRRADDDAISEALATSSGMLFLSDAEGYGLPPLEALWAGCPVVVSASLPALEELDKGGQIRLDTVSAASVQEAVEVLSEPGRNAELRRGIGSLVLPTWNDFAATLERWIARTIGDARVTRTARRISIGA